MKPRKTRVLPILTGALHVLLQWGRGDEAAEDLRTPLGMAELPNLQWGRGDEAAEDALD